LTELELATLSLEGLAATLVHWI